jgi:hypothetical protein
MSVLCRFQISEDRVTGRAYVVAGASDLCRLLPQTIQHPSTNTKSPIG